MTIVEFADEHDLIMKVGERTNPDLPRYYASFEYVDIKEGISLIGAYGDSETIDIAIADYVKDLLKL